MPAQRMDHVGIVVEDMPAAIEFFVGLGFELEGEGTVEGDWVDRVIAVDGVKANIAMLETPGGGARVELSKFHSPAVETDDRDAPSNAVGIRHIALIVEDIDGMATGPGERDVELVGTLERYGDSFRLCYVRGPEGIIVELAEQLG